MQLGPTSRTPPARAASTRATWRAAPSGPVSAKPLDITTATGTPAAAQPATASITASAGSTTSARSIGPGASPKLVTAGRPQTIPPRRLTGTMRPS